MFLQRQISASCVEGEVSALPDGTKFPYKLTDVLPKYILKLGEGKYTSDYISLDASDSATLQLPAGYTASDKLSVVIRANGVCRVVISSPTHGSSTFLLKGTTGLTNGEHKGMIMWQGDVTSITVSLPAAVDPVLIDYFMFVVPDLEDPDSWRLGQTALGYIST